MKKPETIFALSWEDTEFLRREEPGTKGKQIAYSKEEVYAMRRHLRTLYKGRVFLPFAEKILSRYLAW